MTTIRDVARVAGVSTATVSRFINKSGSVRPETCERVRRAMEVCRYKYNALARGFVTKRSHTLGLILPTITNPIVAASTRGVQDYTSEQGYQVILGNSDYQYREEERLVTMLRERQVEGLVVTTTDLRGPALRNLLDEGFPFVLLYSTVRKGPMSVVGIDNLLGGYQATQHLIERNHRRIAMLAGSFSFSDRSLHRWYGYRKCLKEHGIPYEPSLLLQTEYSLASGREGIKKLLSSKNTPTAVFCSNDLIGLGAMQGARDLGMNLPEDLSIVGFDDMEISSFVTPSLTTIRQPAYEMGRLGANLLLEQIQNNSYTPVHKILETKLVVRESTAKYPKGNKKNKTIT